MSTNNNRLFFEAAKHFQLRAHTAGSSITSALRTEWALRDVGTLGPLTSAGMEERIFVMWCNMAHVFAVHDADEQAKNNAAAASATNNHHYHHHQQSRRVASAYLDLVKVAMSDVENLIMTCNHFCHMSRPDESEFRGAQTTAVMLAYLGHYSEASMTLEHMIRSVSENSNNNDDEDDPNSFFPEERALMADAAQLLRVPFTESVDSLQRWRSRGSKLLGNLRSLVTAPTNVLGLPELRQAVLNILFPVSGDIEVVRDFCGNNIAMQGADADNAGARALWSAAALCALAEPLATRSAVSDVLQRVLREEAAAAGGSGGGAATARPAKWYEQALIDGVSADSPKALIDVIETLYKSRSDIAAPALSPRCRVIFAMMTAHLEDLCCDLNDPATLVLRNEAVARYVRALVGYDSNGGALVDAALSYLLHSPLMDPQFAASLLVRIATTSITGCEDGCGGDRAVRIYQEKMAPHSALQRSLRSLWRRAAPRVDWRSIEETVDGVWESAFRDMCRRKAMALWDEKKQQQATAAATTTTSVDACDVGRVVDAISLLVRSGNGMAGETLVREALEEFDVSKPATVQRVLLIGDAAAVGAILDPVVEDINNGRRNNACNSLDTAHTADLDSMTSLSLCRSLSELYRARNAVNVLDFVLPLVEDESDFVSVAPQGVLKFVAGVAAANLTNIHTLRQHGAVSLLFNALADSGNNRNGIVISEAESEVLSTKLARQLLRLPLETL